jgi:hypothetical protein
LEDAPFDVACFEVAFAPASLVRSIGRHCLLCESMPGIDKVYGC